MFCNVIAPLFPLILSNLHIALTPHHKKIFFSATDRDYYREPYIVKKQRTNDAGLSTTSWYNATPIGKKPKKRETKMFQDLEDWRPIGGAYLPDIIGKLH